MNRSYRDNNNSALRQQQHRRGHSFTGVSDENLDLFSGSHRRLSLTPSQESYSQVSSMKLGNISVGSVKLPATRSGLYDLLASTDAEKHDYDWLLTPPETPLCPSSERSEFHPSLAPPRRSITRSTSATKPSRLSTGQLDNSHSSRPARSSSVTRSSVSSTFNSTYSSNRSSSILNTSSASVSSYIRQSSPIIRSSSSARPSTTLNQTTSSRHSTPSKARSASTSTISSSDKNWQSQNSRPSTPSSRSQITNSNNPVTRSNSRPSTPIRRSTSSITSAAQSISVPTGRIMSNGRSQTSTSRPSSPSPRVRQQQPVIPPDFPLDTPPNLRTSLPDRPVSAGRSRQNSGRTSKVNPETSNSVNTPRRHSSPIMSRDRSVEQHGRGYLHSNGHNADVSEPRKSVYGSDSMRKSVKASTTLENGGIGRTLSKKSLDMAIRHMDIRNGSGSLRSLPSTSLFPQSIRSAPSKMQIIHGSGSPTSVNSNESSSQSNNGSILENGRWSVGAEMYESTRYDAILLKEDLKNTTWLHSVDDKADQCFIFENGFEPLPEPFGLS